MNAPHEQTTAQTSPPAGEPLELVTLTPAFGMRNVSPFCLKIELLLTDLGLEFSVREEADPRKTPKGKLPFLQIGTRQLADSELIAEYLDERTEGQVFAGLTAAQLGKGWAAVRLAEDHLYWMIVASRWLDDDWWPHVVEGFFGTVPGPLRALIAKVARRDVVKTYHLHGLGRHSLEEQQGFARRDFAALAGCIEEGGFITGSQANYFDFAVAAILAGIYDNKPGTWLTKVALDYPDLKTYADRVQGAVGVFGRSVVGPNNEVN